MSDREDRQKRLIVEQFTRQAAPFARMPAEANRFVLEAAGVTAGDVVLDVACGPGGLACAFAAAARRVVGIDLTPAMIEHARAAQQALGLTNLEWHTGDVSRLPFADAGFSLVFSRYSFHHLLEPGVVLGEMARVCSASGRVVVADVFASSPEQGEAFDRMERLRDPSHVRALPLPELTALFAGAGLTDVQTRFYRHAFALEQVLAGSFPAAPPDADEVRRLVAADVGVDRLGVQARRDDAGALHIAYPIAVLRGRKP
jgi:ubiquinone/menaquinone biosynthesis C-methylase UbiE